MQDLHAVTDGSELREHADDTYIIIPTVNVDSRGSHALPSSAITQIGRVKITLSSIW